MLWGMNKTIQQKRVGKHKHDWILVKVLQRLQIEECFGCNNKFVGSHSPMQIPFHSQTNQWAS